MGIFTTEICQYALWAPWIICGLIFISGFNVPVSEDLLIILTGAIASTCLREHRLTIYVAVYLAAITSAWIAYTLGRTLGPRLYEMRWFKGMITPRRIDKLHTYYERFGILTFIVGRFIPGGVRNALFMSCGLGKMPFWRFALRDGFACILTTATLLWIGEQAGEHADILLHYLREYELFFIILFSTLVLAAIIYHRRRWN